MYQYGAGTNVGNIRDNNEDSYVCDEDKDLWIIADGMGGLGFGEVASAITTYTVTTLIREGHGVNQAIELAHKNIKEYAKTDALGTDMGTTIVLLLSHGSLYNIFWVGDSRAYLIDKAQMKQVTVDHSLVQALIDQGELTREEAETDPRKNAVTRALGVQGLETVRADSISERWQPGQKILLCSDGLTDCVSDADIESIIRDGGSDQEITDRLIQAALDGGGKDNVTIILVSAPKTVRVADTDTHVPGALTSDDTHVPAAEEDITETGRNGQNESSDIEGDPKGEAAVKQLSLDIGPAPVQMTTNTAEEDSGEAEAVVVPLAQGRLDFDNSNTGNNTQLDQVEDALTEESNRKTGAPWYRISSAAAAAAFFLLVIASIQLDEPAEGIPEHFAVEAPLSTQPTPRHFPEISFENHGTVLQVGIFKRLEGAESQQTELAKLGLAPHIEKRITDTGTHYAVVIGPLDQDQYGSALATLDASGHRYFHRSTSGS